VIQLPFKFSEGHPGVTNCRIDYLEENWSPIAKDRVLNSEGGRQMRVLISEPHSLVVLVIRPWNLQGVPPVLPELGRVVEFDWSVRVVKLRAWSGGRFKIMNVFNLRFGTLISPTLGTSCSSTRVITGRTPRTLEIASRGSMGGLQKGWRGVCLPSEVECQGQFPD